MRRKIFKEEYAIILDYLPHGDPLKGIKEEYYQAIGEKYFMLLALLPKPGIKINILEEVYIGEGERDKIKTVLKKLKYEDLTNLAKVNLEKAIELIIKKREKEFVDFFNKAGPINVRVHALELLPGIGKVTVKRILEEREKKPFESFEDLKTRVKGIGDPIKILKERILREIEGKERHRLFVLQ